ncbi:MAG: hypothetical protein ACRDS1_14925, partial [Pseudonocardiaceae bacterium]
PRTVYTSETGLTVAPPEASIGDADGCTSLSAVSPLNRKAGARRLVDMSAATAKPDQPWTPDLPPDDPWIQTFLISEDARYTQRLGYDEQGRLAEWAVIQSRHRNGQWQRVAVYDICHGKGVHVHLFNRQEIEFTERPVRQITSYRDVEEGLDYVLNLLTVSWQDNERRSDRGY